MKLRDAVENGLASQQMEQDSYEVAEHPGMPRNRRIWVVMKHASTEPSSNGQPVYHGDQLDDVIDFVDNHLGLDPNGWHAAQ